MGWMCFICTGGLSPGECKRQHEGLPGCFYNIRAFQQLGHRFWCILECTGLLSLLTEYWGSCAWAQHCSLCATTPQGFLPNMERRGCREPGELQLKLSRSIPWWNCCRTWPRAAAHADNLSHTAGKVGSDLHNVIDFLKIYFSSIVCSEMTQSGQPQDGMSSSGPQIALQQRGRTGMEWVCCSQLWG